MTRTEYSWMASEELVGMALNKSAASPLETELAQRLAFYMDEFKKDAVCPPQKDV